ncbi:Apoptosis inhibitor 5 [Rhizoclosmatium sp. JEL0117]|nr:Apoptosis inhibitor 5 [Rhizoclosmatium sp. JEL0117]
MTAIPTIESFRAATSKLMDINAGDNVQDDLSFITAYSVILNSAFGDDKLKLLAANSIPKYVASFPKLMDEAVERQLDLCEDDDANIRHAAIKALPQLVGVRSLSLVTYTFSEITLEFTIVETALLSCYSYNPLLTANTIFGQLYSGAIPQIREKILSFVLSKLNPSLFDSKDLLVAYLAGIDTFLAKSCMSVAQGKGPWISEEAFSKLMDFVTQHVLTKEIPKQDPLIGELVLKILVGSIEARAPYDPARPDSIKTLSKNLKLARPLCLPPYNHKPLALIKFFLLRVIVRDQFQRFATESKRHSALKILADTVKLGAKADMMMPVWIVALTDLTKRHIPTNRDDNLETLMFSKLECILYVFYEVQSQNSEYFTQNPVSSALTDYLKALYSATQRLLSISNAQYSHVQQRVLENCKLLATELMKPITKRMNHSRFMNNFKVSWIHTNTDEKANVEVIVIDSVDGSPVDSKKRRAVVEQASDIPQKRGKTIVGASASSPAATSIYIVEKSPIRKIVWETPKRSNSPEHPPTHVLKGNLVEQIPVVVPEPRKNIAERLSLPTPMVVPTKPALSIAERLSRPPPAPPMPLQPLTPYIPTTRSPVSQVLIQSATLTQTSPSTPPPPPPPPPPKTLKLSVTSTQTSPPKPPPPPRTREMHTQTNKPEPQPRKQLTFSEVKTVDVFPEVYSVNSGSESQPIYYMQPQQQPHPYYGQHVVVLQQPQQQQSMFVQQQPLGVPSTSFVPLEQQYRRGSQQQVTMVESAFVPQQQQQQQHRPVNIAGVASQQSRGLNIAGKALQQFQQSPAPPLVQQHQNGQAYFVPQHGEHVTQMMMNPIPSQQTQIGPSSVIEMRASPFDGIPEKDGRRIMKVPQAQSQQTQGINVLGRASATPQPQPQPEPQPQPQQPQLKQEQISIVNRSIVGRGSR